MNEHTATIIQRDLYHDIADELAERIAKITGVEIGEHSSDNDPWLNAKDAADEYLATPHPVEAAKPQGDATRLPRHLLTADVRKPQGGGEADLCNCGDRAASKCPGEWEPGCDLGNNPAYVEVHAPSPTPASGAASPSEDRIDAERYRLVRRGQHWSVIDGIGDTLRAESLDAAIDAARSKEPT